MPTLGAVAVDRVRSLRRGVSRVTRPCGDNTGASPCMLTPRHPPPALSAPCPAPLHRPPTGPRDHRQHLEDIPRAMLDHPMKDHGGGGGHHHPLHQAGRARSPHIPIPMADRRVSSRLLGRRAAWKRYSPHAEKRSMPSEQFEWLAF